MARQPYPLEALRKLRDERAETATERLAQQILRTASAAAAYRERERLGREHGRRTDQSLSAERSRLAGEQLHGAEWQRAADFAAGARAQAQVLAASAAEARAALERERAEEQRLRDELARLEAEAAVARKHEAGFHALREGAAERAEEEAALEQWNARHR